MGCRYAFIWVALFPNFPCHYPILTTEFCNKIRQKLLYGNTGAENLGRMQANSDGSNLHNIILYLSRLQ